MCECGRAGIVYRGALSQTAVIASIALIRLYSSFCCCLLLAYAIAAAVLSDIGGNAQRKWSTCFINNTT